MSSRLIEEEAGIFGLEAELEFVGTRGLSVEQRVGMVQKVAKKRVFVNYRGNIHIGYDDD